MRDFLPGEKSKRERILSIIRESYKRHGFDEIETPVAEDSDRLHAGLGGDNEKLAFGIMKRGLTQEDLQNAKDPLELADLGLRFDLTVPLSRFYATHRAELPSVFRSIQIGPVWRAERPQKGRYRQFVQCDIDVIGEASVLAEAELILASLSAFSALGIGEVTLRINDRRILEGLLESFGFPRVEFASVLISLDKLDKVEVEDILAEIEAKSKAPEAVRALGSFINRPQTLEFLPFGERQIRKALPDGFDSVAVANMVELGSILEAAIGGKAESLPLVFDPFLVRGMGYYTGAIFEAVHPTAGYSVGGGGRYDGMIGRFLGTDVPATGFSIGFERIIDLVEFDETATEDSVALIFDTGIDTSILMKLKAQLVSTGVRVRLERSTRNLKGLLDELAASGFSRFAQVGEATEVDQLTFKNLNQEHK